jgi:hypothetical protein
MATQAREDNGLGGVPLQSAMGIGLIRDAGWMRVGHGDWIINMFCNYFFTQLYGPSYVKQILDGVKNSNDSTEKI